MEAGTPGELHHALEASMWRTEHLEAQLAQNEAEKALWEAERVLAQGQVGRGSQSPHRPRPAGATRGASPPGSSLRTTAGSWLSIWKDFDFEQVGDELGAKELSGYLEQAHGDLREVPLPPPRTDNTVVVEPPRVSAVLGGAAHAVSFSALGREKDGKC